MSKVIIVMKLDVEMKENYREDDKKRNRMVGTIVRTKKINDVSRKLYTFSSV